MLGSDYAVLMMAYGSPDSLDDLESYLLDIRGGRPTPPELVEEIRHRYTLVGGRSPLSDITLAQARSLEERLNASLPGAPFRVYVGMRHWQPRIQEAIARIAADGFQKIVALCMTPHYSRMSVGAYFAKVREAQEALGLHLDVAYVESWHLHPLFIQAIVEKVNAGRRRFPPDLRDQIKVVFTAHSLPVAVIEQGDPYEAQLRDTARLVAERSGLASGTWQFCYQSAGASSVPWLGPQLKDVVAQLGGAGSRNILVVPIGFVADHIETLYDIDVEARRVADRAGAHLERTEALNASSRFIDALADVVRGRIQAR